MSTKRMVLCGRLENSNLTDKALLAHDGIPTFLTKRYNPAWASVLTGEVNRAGKKKYSVRSKVYHIKTYLTAIYRFFILQLGLGKKNVRNKSSPILHSFWQITYLVFMLKNADHPNFNFYSAKSLHLLLVLKLSTITRALYKWDPPNSSSKTNMFCIQCYSKEK